MSGFLLVSDLFYLVLLVSRFHILCRGSYFVSLSLTVSVLHYLLTLPKNKPVFLGYMRVTL